MASVVLQGVRVLFLVLTLTQCFLLASYPARYSNDPVWYAAAFFYTPSIILWLILVFGNAANVRLSFCVWALYVVVGLIPNIGIVFGVAGNGLIFNNSHKRNVCSTQWNECVVRGWNRIWGYWKWNNFQQDFS